MAVRVRVGLKASSSTKRLAITLCDPYPSLPLARGKVFGLLLCKLCKGKGGFDGVFCVGGDLGFMNGNPALSNRMTVCLHPNEVDRKRIERALKGRKRYRYVTPEVHPIPDGYEIVSACCSRNIDPDGGIIDIARLEFQAQARCWRLYRKDHKAGLWVRHGDYPGLAPILELLIEDPDRRFWQ
jgi:hypothetical protein